MKTALLMIATAIPCIISAGVILISGAMMDARVNGLTESIYPLLLPLAVLFLHRVFIRYFIPFEPHEIHRRQEIAEEAKKHYKKSFWSGCIGFGYLAIFSYILLWFSMGHSKPELRRLINPVPFGMALIGLGLLAQIHGYLKFFIAERKTET